MSLQFMCDRELSVGGLNRFFWQVRQFPCGERYVFTHTSIACDAKVRGVWWVASVKQPHYVVPLLSNHTTVYCC